jgi:tetratricopeptide (TPR) repeat protein
LTGGRAEAKDNVCLGLSCRSNVISAYDQSTSAGETGEEAVQVLTEADGVYSWQRQFQPVLATITTATDALQSVQQGDRTIKPDSLLKRSRRGNRQQQPIKSRRCVKSGTCGELFSTAYQQSGNLDEAWRIINTSLTLLSSFNTSQSTRIRAQVFNAQGSLQFAQGQTEAALKTWQQATALYQQLGDQPRWIGSLISGAGAADVRAVFSGTTNSGSG